MVAWAVPSSFSLLTIFKTRDSFSAGQGPNDRSSLACELPAPPQKRLGACLSVSLAVFLPGPCCRPVGGQALGPPALLRSQTTLGPKSRATPPPTGSDLPVYSPCSRHLSESPGRGEAGFGSGQHWAQAGRAERGSWTVGWQACPHRGQGSRRRRWRSLLWEETQKALQEAGQLGQERVPLRLATPCRPQAQPASGPAPGLLLAGYLLFSAALGVCCRPFRAGTYAHIPPQAN